ncbi:MAG: hypothetical protein KFH98_09520, partial [Gemmatimonadetes bacterium]|nr:hypothetical protein [Gemmatimonadota bacterium]
GAQAEAGRAGGSGASGRSLSTDVGINRFEWDLHASAGSGRGPLAPPGRYTARLTVPNIAPVTTPVVVDLDPRLVADGITTQDLHAQYELATRVAQLASNVQQLQSDLRAARERAANDRDALARVTALEERVVTRSGQAYPQPMLAAQVSYLNGIVSRNDNRPHRDAYERYEELRAEVDKARTELQRIQ